ncbi:MAG: DUF2271 domain-containing protein [Paracoccaceae bacterium]|nr:DUF2271 domain-containing protein [Paracoccaceae bacterium]
MEKRPDPIGPNLWRIASRCAPVALAILGGTAQPDAAQAREVTLTTTMNDTYRGVGGYVIWYITDPERGNYKGTLWAAGRSTRYYGQFRHWWRATAPISKTRHKEYDGISGASLERGEVLTVTVEIADELFDAGYVIRVDSTVQEGHDYPSDVVVPLTSEMAGVPVEGQGYVASVRFDLVAKP